MKLQQIAIVKTNFPNADFYITRKGSLKTVGKPTKTFRPQDIGIKVTEEKLIYWDYLYYCFLNLYNTGQWQPLANGTLALVHIKVSDVKNIDLVTV